MRPWTAPWPPCAPAPADYLVKPAELDRVQAVLRHAKKTSALRNEIGALRDELRRLGRFGRMLGSCTGMQTLYDQLARVAPTSATVHAAR